MAHQPRIGLASATIESGMGQAYTAQGFDAYGNPLGDVTAATTFTIGSATAAPGRSARRRHQARAP